MQRSEAKSGMRHKGISSESKTHESFKYRKPATDAISLVTTCALHYAFKGSGLDAVGCLQVAY